LNFHYFKINERERKNGRKHYWHHLRQFLTIYKGRKDDDAREIFSGHLETIVRKRTQDIFSLRLSIGNDGSETPWDGHILLFGAGFFWGHTAFRKLAGWLTRCSGYKYDNRVWSLRLSDWRLYWEFAQHSDMCRKHNRPSYRQRTFRRGSWNLNLADKIWGPKRYSYEDVDSFVTTIKMPEGEYAAVLRLQRVYLGRTKVAKHKHEQSWTIEVDSPKGIPTHYDHSGGWKGDRTYGFGVHFDYPRSEGWQQDAEAAVTAWVLKERARTGFREPQKAE
jgi:hypothetical protein